MIVTTKAKFLLETIKGGSGYSKLNNLKIERTKIPRSTRQLTLIVNSLLQTKQKLQVIQDSLT